MYTPKHFQITDQEEIIAFINDNAFGQLISVSHAGLFSSHLPFLLSENNDFLLAHLAKQNTQLNGLDGEKVMVTLQGPHDYISPSWYASKGVPTWNYQAVHVWGRCTVFDDVERLAVLVNELTSKYEADLPKPWQPNYAGAMLTAIVGVEIAIERVECTFKLSQNRPIADQRNVIERLRERGSVGLASAMQKNISRDD